MPDPIWITWARSQIGTAEVPGAKSNPKILSWAQRLGAKVLGISYTDDDTPWCGLFVTAALAQAGLTSPPISIRASSWETWGVRTTPRMGAVLVFTRPGGGHVGFYVGETDTHFLVLGGNQGNKVSEVLIEKARCTAVRWPMGVRMTSAPSKVKGSSAPVSRNEQ